MIHFKKIILMSALSLAVSSVSFAEETSLINKDSNWYKMSFMAETGFVTVLSHTIQFGNTGSVFDYKEEGNQDILFPYQRFSAEFRVFDRHLFVFLYQPLEVITTAKAARNLAFYTTAFPTGTVLDIKYGFSFYRASYVWYFIQEPKSEFGMGLSMQVRNASIQFKAADGTDITIQENVGPVPIIKMTGKMALDNGVWGAIDADGFYASSAIFNGSGFPFVGAIWDVSARVGVELKNSISPYLNIRCLGGGAKGTSRSEDTQGDGYTENWLNTLSVTLGVEFK